MVRFFDNLNVPNAKNTCFRNDSKSAILDNEFTKIQQQLIHIISKELFFAHLQNCHQHPSPNETFEGPLIQYSNSH